MRSSSMPARPGSSAGEHPTRTATLTLARCFRVVVHSPLLHSLLMLAVCWLHILLSPHTKVEESFNVQAMHDILYTRQLQEFDHLSFPGVVPRSLAGAITVSAMSLPFVRAMDHVVPLLTSPDQADNRLHALYICRCMLALLFVASHHQLRAAFSHRFNVKQHRFNALPLIVTLLTTLTQFHTLFYASRPLPNTFASVCINLAAAALLRDQAARMTCWLAFVCILFRCDMLLLAVPMLCAALIATARHRTRQQCITMVKSGLIASLVSIALTLAIDSYFWRQSWMWPELRVLLFNSPLHQDGSLAYGVQPWHWYASSALPRAMLASLLIVPAAAFKRLPTNWTQFRASQITTIVDKQVIVLLFMPSCVFIALYSVLPHKELRFILPCMPLLTCCAALTLQRLFAYTQQLWQQCASNAQARSDTNNTKRSKFDRQQRLRLYAMLLVCCAVALSLCVSSAAVCLLTLVSSRNYPGGEAMQQLHSIVLPSLQKQESVQHTATNASLPIVHISNLAATSGVTRFHERRHWLRYSKLEHVPVDELHRHAFDYLIASQPDIAGYAPLNDSRPILAFSHLNWRDPLHLIGQSPQIWILKRIESAPHQESVD